MRHNKQPIEESAERRYASRRPVRLRLKAWVDGDERTVSVRDLSQTGFLVESSPPLLVDQSVELDLPHEGRKKATVVWSGTISAGCTFDGSISRAAYSAAQLKSHYVHAPAQADANDRAIPAAARVPEEDDTGKLPARQRVAIIAAAAALSWVPLVLLAWWLLG